MRERLMSYSARLVTADELERMPEDDSRYELVRGRLIRMSPVAPRHGGVTMTIGAMLWQHVRARALGQVWTEVGFQLSHDPDTVRAPDIAFVRVDRLPMPEASGFYRGAPDVAVEVLSPGDPPSDVRDKVRDYFAAGTPMVVVLDPAARRVTVHKPGTTPRVHREGNTLDLDPIVDGFSVSVGSLFE